MIYIDAFCLLLSLLMLLNIGYSTLRLGISPMPSSLPVRKTMIDLFETLNTKEILHLADLGAGWGGLARQLARAYPQIQVTAYEASLLPWIWFRFTQLIQPLPNLAILKKNFLKEDLKSQKIDVFFCYLCPSIMQDLAVKLSNEADAYQLISAAFALHQKQDSIQITAKDWQKTPVYLYSSESYIKATRTSSKNC